jgi:hypothetical protein
MEASTALGVNAGETPSLLLGWLVVGERVPGFALDMIAAGAAAPTGVAQHVVGAGRFLCLRRHRGAVSHRWRWWPSPWCRRSWLPPARSAPG